MKTIPKKLQPIFERWDEQIRNGFDYLEIAAFQKECEGVGYTFDYYLDAIPFNFRRLKKC